MKRIWNYLRESVDELRKVKWPTRQTTIQYSLIVLVSVVSFTAIFGGLDIALQAAVAAVLE